ncbi:MAG: YkgJ family cysteine cluster protein [Candidatus Hermodarchaeota archaeon]
MNSAIEGPNCVDPKNCRGDCCSIKIDVPKVLAREYIKRGYASENDFTRSNTFSFQLRFNEKTGKCFLYDPKINGCTIHNSGIKPVQCWIYPTGFSNENNKDIKCKKLSGWKIKDSIKTKRAEKILEQYVFLCKLEAKKELSSIQMRLTKQNIEKNSLGLVKKFRKIKPSTLAGIRDDWDDFEILSAEGVSFQMKKFCLAHNPECSLIPDNYLDCQSLCELICLKLYEYLKFSLYKYIKIYGQDSEGEYAFIKLFNFEPPKF